jgi:hypothetical protein
MSRRFQGGNLFHPGPILDSGDHAVQQRILHFFHLVGRWVAWIENADMAGLGLSFENAVVC